MTLPAVSLICLLSWICIPLLAGDAILQCNQTQASYLFSNNLGWPALSGASRFVVGFLLYTLTAYALMVLNNTFALVRIRATVQTTLFMLFIAACPLLYTCCEQALTSFILTASLYCLFSTYQKQSPVRVFYAFFLLGTSCIFLPQLILLTPLWLLGTVEFQSFSFKSFCASAGGILLPFWFLFGHAFFYDNLTLFTDCIHEMFHFYPIAWTQNMQLWKILAGAFLLLMTLVSSMHTLLYSYEDKIQTRAYLSFLIRFACCLILFLGLQPVHANTLLITLTQVASILAAHFFVLTRSRTSNVVFITSILALLALFTANLWMIF